MIKEELKSLFRNKLLLVVLIAIILIPSIYAGLFLSSMWDPYGELEYLPVAVVNQDQKVTYNDSELAIGSELAESLQKNDSMAFNIVDADTAKEGLKNGTYYMVITIPNNFSANAATLMDADPKKMELVYETNPGKNYISMKLSESAMKEIKNNITGEVTRTYAKTVFDSMKQIGNGFDSAAAGTLEMIDGEDQLVSGNKQITDNMLLLSSSMQTLNAGAKTLMDGIGSYTNGVDQVYQGVTSLNEGTNTLKSGANRLAAGSTQLLSSVQNIQSSLNSSLTDQKVASINLAVNKLPELNSGIQQLNSAVSGIDLSGITNGMTSVGSNLNTAGTDLSSAAGTLAGKYAITQNKTDMGGSAGQMVSAYTTLATLLATDPSLTSAQKSAIISAMNKLYDPSNPTDVGTAFGSTMGSLSKISAAGNELSSAGNTLTVLSRSDMTSSITALKSNVAKLAQSSNMLLPASGSALHSLLDGMLKIQTGMNQTMKNDGATGLVEGMNTLNDGIKSLQSGITGDNGLNSGVAKLLNGTSALVANNQTLNNGIAQLYSGSSQINDGAVKLTDASKKLGDGLLDLKNGTNTLNTALLDGAKEIKSTNASDATLDMFADPVTTQEEKLTTVENNGHGMAAYMLCVGLWVGCLAFCLMYPLTEYRGELKNSIAWWGSKAIVAYAIATLMAIVAMVVLHVFNGFNPVSMKKTLLVATVSIFCFMSIMYFFNILLGKVGSFLMLVFMVFQLAGSAGTYPVEISGPLSAAIHKYVPFTYTVDAFRSAISGGESFASEMAILIILALVFTLMTILVFHHRVKRIRESRPVIYDWIKNNNLA